MDYIIGIIGMFIASLLFGLSTHALLCSTDVELYKNNKYNENRKTVKIGVKWIFWRSRKDNEKEIFYLVFVHELINLLFIMVSTVSMVILICNQDIIILIALILSFVYFCYIILLNYFLKKR